MSRSTRIIRLATFALAVLGLLLSIGLIPELVWLMSERPFWDVHAYYDAGTRLNAGAPLYVADMDVNDPAFYRYPPLLAIVFRPLALLPFGVAAVLWEIGMIASLVLTVRLLAPPGAVLRALGILAFPITWSIAVGQAQVLVTWLLAVGAPWSVALGGQLKVLPALAAIYWVGRRDWRSFRRFLAWTLALVIVQVVLEPRGSLAFLEITNLAQVGEISNLSVYTISPGLWAVTVGIGAGVALTFAGTKYGWAAAVALSVLATPRLLSYLLMALLATLRRDPGLHARTPQASDRPAQPGLEAPRSGA